MGKNAPFMESREHERKEKAIRARRLVCIAGVCRRNLAENKNEIKNPAFVLDANCHSGTAWKKCTRGESPLT